MILTYSLLAVAVVALWWPGEGLRARLWLFFFLAALAAGLVSGVVGAVGLAAVALFALATFYFARAHLAWLRGLAGGVLLALAVGFMLHRVPGFHNPCVIADVRFSADAVPFTLYLNFDKTLIGLFIIGWAHERLQGAKAWYEMLRLTAPRALAVIAAVLVLSVVAGYVRFEPKFPAETWLWLGVNLIFTCLAEEALFRGFIQEQLQRWWGARGWGGSAALAVAALAFGGAHFAGGPMYVALAAVAGAGYGWIYQRTGRIEASILAHFTLNTLHFLCFTYPALAR